jgi:hypothetical protein
LSERQARDERRESAERRNDEKGFHNEAGDV